MTLSSVVKKHEDIMKPFSIFVKDAGSQKTSTSPIRKKRLQP